MRMYISSKLIITIGEPYTYDYFCVSLISECKILDSVHSTPGSSVLLPCSEHYLQNRTEQVTWKIIIGHKSTDITQYQPPNKPSNSTEKLLKPLYERAIQLPNGSLLIRDAEYTDESWYRCRVNDKTCYEVKLLMKGVLECNISKPKVSVQTLTDIGSFERLT